MKYAILSAFNWQVREAPSLKIKEVKYLTEQCTNSIGWKYLQPFVEETISDEIEKITKENFRDWLTLASKREVTRKITDLANIFPNTNEKTIYLKKYMFGGTPMLEAINLASLRFFDSILQGYQKNLIIILDGEYDNELEVKQISMLWKDQGVTIGCGYVGKTD